MGYVPSQNCRSVNTIIRLTMMWMAYDDVRAGRGVCKGEGVPREMQHTRGCCLRAKHPATQSRKVCRSCPSRRISGRRGRGSAAGSPRNNYGLQRVPHDEIYKRPEMEPRNKDSVRRPTSGHDDAGKGPQQGRGEDGAHAGVVQSDCFGSRLSVRGRDGQCCEPLVIDEPGKCHRLPVIATQVTTGAAIARQLLSYTT
jgi:hypothetical protein